MRVALVGESHAQVVWPIVAAALRNAGHEVVLQEAKPGWSAAKFLQDGIVARLQAVQPDAVVVLASGNNSERNASRYAATVAWMLSAAPGARWLWVGPSTAIKAPWSTSHETTRALESSVVPVAGATWLDSAPFTGSGHRDDGVHFTSSGYRAWAAGILATLIPFLGVGAGSGSQVSAPLALRPRGWFLGAAGILGALIGVLLIRRLRR